MTPGEIQSLIDQYKEVSYSKTIYSVENGQEISINQFEVEKIPRKKGAPKGKNATPDIINIPKSELRNDYTTKRKWYSGNVTTMSDVELSGSRISSSLWIRKGITSKSVKTIDLCERFIEIVNEQRSRRVDKKPIDGFFYKKCLEYINNHSVIQ